jgi:hypothetical protein
MEEMKQHLEAKQAELEEGRELQQVLHTQREAEFAEMQEISKRLEEAKNELLWRNRSVSCDPSCEVLSCGLSIPYSEWLLKGLVCGCDLCLNLSPLYLLFEDSNPNN